MAERKTNTPNRKQTKKREQFDLLGGRVPPHNLDMERAVLCCALIDPNGFARVVNYVEETSFYEHRHQVIFQAMSELYNAGSGIDGLTVSEKLKSLDTLDEAGGDAYIASLTNEVGTAAYAEQYAETVREKYILRRLIKSSTSVALDAYEAPEATDLLDRLLKDLFEIYTNRSEGGFKPLSNALTKTMEYLEDHHKRKGDLTGVDTGFKELNNYTSGFQNGDLVILAARPSMGKTAFSLDIARNASSMNDTGVAYFSLEMSSMAIAMRLLSSSAKIDLHRLRSGKLKEREWVELGKAVSNLSDSKLFIDDTGGLGLMELRARARQLKQQHDIGMIVIDYLQLMKPPKADSREQEVSQLSRGLKGLARELDVPVVALSQLSRAVEQRGGDKRPVLSDLRDSGSIEQDADVVMFIFRASQYKKEKHKNYEDDSDNQIGENNEDEADDNSAEIIIRKQRNGPTGTVNLVFLSEFAKFVDATDYHAKEQAKSFAGAAQYSRAVVDEEEDELGDFGDEQSTDFSVESSDDSDDDRSGNESIPF